MLQLVKESIEFVCAIVYFPFHALLRKSPLRVVVCYHDVKEREAGNFRKQMACLAKENYKVVKISEIMTACAKVERAVVAISFDDAFVSILENALPSLEEFGFPASIAVPTANLAQPPQWDISAGSSHVREIVMSDKQIEEVDEDGFELISHTASHPKLTRISDSQLKHELEDSKKTLESITGCEVVAICYPHGDYDARVCHAAQEAGYRLGFTMEPYRADESPGNFEIGRFSVSARDGLTKFRLKINGAYQMLRYLRMLKRILTGGNWRSLLK
ncbi:MAG: polysaccharide deacetylase family protein [Sedimentisphaerales bacterium]|nr:polysaccharide deacetylase family protein [Sedimentisphaerales bacterium]